MLTKHSNRLKYVVIVERYCLRRKHCYHMKEDVHQQKHGGKSWNQLYIVIIVIQSSLQGLMPSNMRRKSTPPGNCAPACAPVHGPVPAFALISSPA